MHLGQHQPLDTKLPYQMKNNLTSLNFANSTGAVRLFVGVSSWLAPSLVSSFSAMGQELDWKDKYLWRLFGARDAALAVGLFTSEGRGRQAWITAALCSDFSDAVSSFISGKKAGLSPSAQAVHSAPGVLGTVFGLLALMQERRRGED